MQLTNSRAAYGAVPQLIHWLTALFVIAGWLLGQFGDDLPKGSARAFGLFSHITLGECVFALVLLRVIWRFANPPPPPEATPFGRFLEVGAKASHFTLYALLFAIPFLGMIVQLKRGHPLPVFGLWEFQFALARRPRHRAKCSHGALLSRRRAFDPRRRPCLRGADASLDLARPYLKANAAGFGRIEREAIQPLRTFSAAAAPARNMERSLDTARNLTPRLASAAARSAEWQ